MVSSVGVVTAVTSAIVGAVVSVVDVSSSEVSVETDEPFSSLPQEMMVRLENNTNKIRKILSILPPIN